MKHLSIIKKRDLGIGNFFTQTRLTFNKLSFTFFAALFAYAGMNIPFSSMSKLDIGFFIFSSFFHLIIILIFVFVFGIAMAIFTPMLKKGILGKHDFKFMEDGFTESTEYNESFHKYNAITDVFTRFGTIYIGLGGMQWHMLPKRDFKSNEERLALIKLLNERSKI